MTPYHSVFPIYYILDTDKENPDLPRHTRAYQILTKSINWISVSTQPYMTPTVSFLLLCQNSPVAVQYEDVLYALIYFVITSFLFITFTSKFTVTQHHM